MAGQINQQVDPVVANLVSEFRVAQADRAAPVVGKVAEALGDRIRRRHFGIAIHLD
jgi:hypothetical protein